MFNLIYMYCRIQMKIQKPIRRKRCRFSSPNVCFFLCCELVDLAATLAPFKMNICGLVDTDEVEKSPDERNEEQRALRSTFCPPSAESHGRQRVLASQRGLTNVSIGQLSMALCCLAPHLSATGACVREWDTLREIGGCVWIGSQITTIEIRCNLMVWQLTSFRHGSYYCRIRCHCVFVCSSVCFLIDCSLCVF